MRSLERSFGQNNFRHNDQYSFLLLCATPGHDNTVDWRALEQEPADRLRSIGVNIFTVGMTSRAEPEELQSLAGSENHVISLQGYGELSSAVDPLVEKACTLASVVKRSEKPESKLLLQLVHDHKNFSTSVFSFWFLVVMAHSKRFLFTRFST